MQLDTGSRHLRCEDHILNVDVRPTSNYSDYDQYFLWGEQDSNHRMT
jgi:hypothetical protein